MSFDSTVMTTYGKTPPEPEGHMTKMDSIKHLKIFNSRTKGPITLGLSMWHIGIKTKTTTTKLGFILFTESQQWFWSQSLWNTNDKNGNKQFWVFVTFQYWV